MKVMFDTNVYISYIRNGCYGEHLERHGTVKYIAGIVLMELWAGARTRQAERFLQQNLKHYSNAGRVVVLHPEHYVAIGQFIADLPKQYASLVQKAGFLNDIHIAFAALSIGAVLYTEDTKHFGFIGSRLHSLKIGEL